MTPIPAPADFDDWDALLALIHASFAYMEGVIDPPSSLHRLDAAGLAAKAQVEHLWIMPDLSGCAFFREDPDALYIGKLAIHPDAQGRGLGRAFVTAAETVARRCALPCLRLETRVELTGNQRAFARMGFVEVGRTAHAGYDRPTSVTMEMPLAAH